MSIFDNIDTLCVREGNKCKRKGKCQRFLEQNRSGKWEAEYYDEFGQYCNHFIPQAKNNPR